MSCRRHEQEQERNQGERNTRVDPEPLPCDRPVHQRTHGELSGKPTEHTGQLRKANRGFGDHKLYRVLTEELKFDFVIRFRGNIAVTATSGEARVAADWVGAGGRARTLRGAAVTAEAYPVATVVCVRAKGMKEPWCLAASTADEPARALINLYAKRWEIEGGFRDTKDLRFGMGLGSMHVSTPDRRDRLWLINAFAVVLLTLLGAAGEQLGYDRHLKTNTTKRRTHSLFRQSRSGKFIPDCRVFAASGGLMQAAEMPAHCG